MGVLKLSLVRAVQPKFWPLFLVVLVVVAAWYGLSQSTHHASVAIDQAKGKSVQPGDPDLYAALDLFESHRAAEALTLLRTSASKGNTNAQLLLSFRELAKGPGSDEALKLLQASAAGNNPIAQALLGSEYLLGQTDKTFYPKDRLPQDVDRALRLLESSAGRGCAIAACALGDYYRNISPSDARKWYEVAALRRDYFATDFDPLNISVSSATPSQSNPENENESVLSRLAHKHVRPALSDSPSPELIVMLRKLARMAVYNSQKSLGDLEAAAGNYQVATGWYAMAEDESDSRLGLPITANRLVLEYQSNEIRADSAFKGHTVSVTGYVSAVGKDILGHAYVTLDSGESLFGQVQCLLRPEAIEKASALDPGQTVTLTGRVDGKLMNVIVDDCSF